MMFMDLKFENWDEVVSRAKLFNFITATQFCEIIDDEFIIVKRIIKRVYQKVLLIFIL